MQEVIKKSLGDIEIDINNIGDDDNLFDIGLDSLQTVMLISKIEENSGRSVELSNFSQDKFQTINTINDYLNNGGLA